ncbi:MAG: hypothetical protein ACI9W4_001392 [Rhodothermales bacterium]|jgi:hypothetical protein
MRSLYDSDTFDEALSRIDSLNSDSQPGWGKMNAAQMLAHCAEVQEVSNGKALSGSSWILKLFKGVIRKMVVGPKPYPHSLGTHPQYVIADARDFTRERDRLLAALNVLREAGPDRAGEVFHALFGTMTAAERGGSMFKHLEHHLIQFGA